jgi:hypothetical protein
MLIQALLHQVRGLNAEAKFVLLTLIQRAGLGRCTLALSGKKMAVLLEMPQARAKEALSQLVDLKILRLGINDRRSVRASSYDITPRYAALIGMASNAHSCDAMERALICCFDTRLPRLTLEEAKESAQTEMEAVRGTRNFENITKVNRLLLAALIAHSDRLGVVRGVSLGDLRKICGFGSDEQVSNRLKTLKRQGYIRSWTPGTSSPVLRKKEKTTFYLCFTGTLFIDADVRVGIVTFRSTPIPDHLVTGNGHLLRVQHYRKLRKFDQFEPLDTACEALLAERLGFFKILQGLVNKYVAALLSRHWLDIDEWRVSSRPQLPGIYKMICEDFHSSTSSVKKADVAGAEYLNDFVAWLYEAVYSLAWTIKRSLSYVSGVDFAGVDFAVMTRDRPNHHIGVVLLYQNRVGREVTNVLLMDEHGSDFEVVDFWAHERDLTDAARVAYHLAARG